MGSWLKDVPYAARTLLRSPGYTAVAVLTLALGIGANSAIFSVVRGVILKPLEYRTPERLVMIASQFPTMGFDKFWVSAPEYEEFREWNTSFDEVAIYNTGFSTVEGTDQPLRVPSASSTAGFFDVLGVEPRYGRVFTAEEDRPGAEAVAVLSFELWQRAFGADTSVLGSRVRIDNEPRTIVGIMPPLFDIDDNQAELWLPLALDPENFPGRASHNYYMVGRLKADTGIDGARAELGTLMSRWKEEGGDTHTPDPEFHPIIMTSLHEEVVGETRPALLLLLASVGLVLLVACSNVANLLLARAESRQKEIAVRNAMGASKWALFQQFMAENLLLSVLGGVTGLIFSFWGLRILLATYPASVPRAAEITLDVQVLLFTLAISVLSGLFFGLAPLLHLGTKNLTTSLKEGGQRSTSSSARQLARRFLVVAEVALAVALVVCCGLLLRSFWAMQSVEPGFNPRGLSTFQLYLPATTYEGATDQVAFFRDLNARLTDVPGIDAASSMSGLPPRRRLNANDMQFEGVQPSEDGPPLNVDYWQFVTDDYFNTMQIPLVEGRVFSASDDGASTPVAIVNETTAATFWPGQSPLGRRLKPPNEEVPWFTVVGVVRDVKQAGLQEETGTEVYFFYPQTGAAVGFAPRGMNVVVRSSLPPETVASSAQEVVWERDRALPLANFLPMEEVLAESLSRPRFVTLLIVIFAVLALALAAIGTYGVMSYSVTERTNEIGIRIALGAGTGRVLKMVLTQGLALVGIGLAIGLALAFGISRVLGSFLFGVGSGDPATYLTVPLVLTAVAVAACVVPAYRAVRIEPVIALRHE